MGPYLGQVEGVVSSFINASLRPHLHLKAPFQEVSQLIKSSGAEWGNRITKQSLFVNLKYVFGLQDVITPPSKEQDLMNTVTLLICGSLLLTGRLVVAQALSYDLHYVLPGERSVGGVSLGFHTPMVDRVDKLNDFVVLAKYALGNELEVGVRGTFGLRHTAIDDFSALILGIKYGLVDHSAIAVNLTPLNRADQIGVSMGVMKSWAFRRWGVNSHLLFGFLDGYRPRGSLVDGLIQPVKPFGERVTTYLDILLTTDTDKPTDRLGVLFGPNLDVELISGWVLNTGITVSVHSGKSITYDRDLGVGLAVFKNAALW